MNQYQYGLACRQYVIAWGYMIVAISQLQLALKAESRQDDDFVITGDTAGWQPAVPPMMTKLASWWLSFLWLYDGPSKNNNLRFVLKAKSHHDANFVITGGTQVFSNSIWWSCRSSRHRQLSMARLAAEFIGAISVVASFMKEHRLSGYEHCFTSLGLETSKGKLRPTWIMLVKVKVFYMSDCFSILAEIDKGYPKQSVWNRWLDHAW